MSRKVTSLLRDGSGLSLTELVVTMALFALVMAGVVGIWGKAQEAYFIGSESAEVQQNVRAAMDFMVREIRSAGRDATVCAFDYSTSSTVDCDGVKVANCTARLAGSGTPTWETANGVGGPGCTGLYAIPFGQATATTLRIPGAEPPVHPFLLGPHPFADDHPALLLFGRSVPQHEAGHHPAAHHLYMPFGVFWMRRTSCTRGAVRGRSGRWGHHLGPVLAHPRAAREAGGLVARRSCSRSGRGTSSCSRSLLVETRPSGRWRVRWVLPGHYATNIPLLCRARCSSSPPRSSCSSSSSASSSPPCSRARSRDDPRPKPHISRPGSECPEEPHQQTEGVSCATPRSC